MDYWIKLFSMNDTLPPAIPAAIEYYNHLGIKVDINPIYGWMYYNERDLPCYDVEVYFEWYKGDEKLHIGFVISQLGIMTNNLEEEVSVYSSWWPVTDSDLRPIRNNLEELAKEIAREVFYDRGTMKDYYEKTSSGLSKFRDLLTYWLDLMIS